VAGREETGILAMVKESLEGVGSGARSGAACRLWWSEGWAYAEAKSRLDLQRPFSLRFAVTLLKAMTFHPSIAHVACERSMERYPLAECEA
jgi:hypothetical protein